MVRLDSSGLHVSFFEALFGAYYPQQCSKHWTGHCGICCLLWQILFLPALLVRLNLPLAVHTEGK